MGRLISQLQNTWLRSFLGITHEGMKVLCEQKGMWDGHEVVGREEGRGTA